MKANCLTRETILDLGTERKLPSFRVGDTVEVSQLVSEGDKERIQLLKAMLFVCTKTASHQHSLFAAWAQTASELNVFSLSIL